MAALPEPALDLLRRGLDAGGLVLALTGAGLSAESGIPTFRGPEGYWTVGSRNYHPSELATRAAFERMPWEVWAWYAYRRGVCRAAEPNPAHRALAELDARLGERFVLVTQNVDGLHLRAGNDPRRTWQIHGNIERMRCFDDCSSELFPVPLDPVWARGRAVGEADRARLVCPRCGARARPHVLWFDEYYDEAHFRFESSLAAAEAASLLLVVGSSGATNLPLQIAGVAARRGIPMVVVDPADNPFSAHAAASPHGAVLRGGAVAWVPAVTDALLHLSS